MALEINKDLYISDSTKQLKDLVVESGSNSNGDYIKYADGTLICTNRVRFTKNITSGYESSYFSSAENINFPFTFISEPNVIASIEMNNSLMGLTIISRTTTYFGCYVWKQQSKSNVTFYINYIAIGKWK